MSNSIWTQEDATRTEALYRDLRALIAAYAIPDAEQCISYLVQTPDVAVYRWLTTWRLLTPFQLQTETEAMTMDERLPAYMLARVEDTAEIASGRLGIDAVRAGKDDAAHRARFQTYALLSSGLELAPIVKTRAMRMPDYLYNQAARHPRHLPLLCAIHETLPYDRVRFAWAVSIAAHADNAPALAELKRYLNATTGDYEVSKPLIDSLGHRGAETALKALRANGYAMTPDARAGFDAGLDSAGMAHLAKMYLIAELATVPLADALDAYAQEERQKAHEFTATLMTIRARLDQVLNELIITRAGGCDGTGRCFRPAPDSKTLYARRPSVPCAAFCTLAKCSACGDKMPEYKLEDNECPDCMTETCNCPECAKRKAMTDDDKHSAACPGDGSCWTWTGEAYTRDEAIECDYHCGVAQCQQCGIWTPWRMLAGATCKRCA
ncbi:MAG: hypothetical protein KGL39_01215 [Patescibacteria group bacterium]|nr:hypothetical protein [Patescibacteria group bacterium]